MPISLEDFASGITASDTSHTTPALGGAPTDGELIVICVAGQAGSAWTLTGLDGFTEWLTSSSANFQCKMLYKVASSDGTTFALTTSVAVPLAWHVRVFSGIKTAGFAGDSVVYESDSATTVPLSVTPTDNDSVVVSFASSYDNVAGTITTAFGFDDPLLNLDTATVTLSSGSLILTSAAQQDTSWTISAAWKYPRGIAATFEGLAAGGGVTVPALDDGMFTGGFQPLSAGLR